MREEMEHKFLRYNYYKLPLLNLGKIENYIFFHKKKQGHSPHLLSFPKFEGGQVEGT